MRHIAILLISLLGLSATLVAQRPGERAHGPKKVEPIDQSEADAFVEDFRNQRLRGDYIFLFNLNHFERRGGEVPYEGILWGTWNVEGPVNRVSVWPRGQRKTHSRDFIVQGGAEPKIWSLEDGEVVELKAKDQGKPFFKGMVYTPYDVVMPFAYWEMFDYTGSKRVRGRPAHQFVFYAPGDVTQRMPDLAAVELVLDADFNAPIKAAMLDVNGEDLRTMDFSGFKEINEQYIVKEIDLIDERTRDYTRFRVTDAALGLDLPAEVFEPRDLSEGVPSLTRVIFEPV
ncbi:MAG: outer membrane lipoprotein-sorting protein [Verrucomicrobiota bacterium]